MSNIKSIIIVILAALLAVSGYFNYDQSQRFNNLDLENQKSNTALNAYKQLVYTQSVLRTEDQKQIKDLTDSVFNLKRKHEKQIKNVIAYYSENTKTVIKNVPTRWVDTSYMKEFSDSVKLHCANEIKYILDSTVEIGRKSRVDSTYFNVALTVTKDGINIDSLELRDSVYLRFVEKKGGILKKNSKGKRPLFSKKYTEVQVLHTNPFVTITSQTSVIYKPESKSLLVPGFLTGAGIATILTILL